MAHEPFESWKRSPPASAKEEAAADLLKQVGDAEMLSPQAMHRVEHRLRPPARPRLPLFVDARFAIAALGGVLSLVAIAVVGIQFVDLKAQPMAQTPPGFAQPPPVWTKKAREPSAKLAVKEAAKPSGQAAFGASPAADRAEPMLAPAAASAPPRVARGALESDALSHASSEQCRAEIPGFSATLANNTGDVERALFGRGSCWLKLANLDAGVADLRAYLARFPAGRFTGRARQLLGEVGEGR
jgi:hypothetical protein